MRTIQHGVLDNFLKVTENWLCQAWLGRALFGGIYVRMAGHWMPVDVMMTCDDGARVFVTQYTGSSFHESFLGVDDIQVFA
jgi:hypothetical protein